MFTKAIVSSASVDLCTVVKISRVCSARACTDVQLLIE